MIEITHQQARRLLRANLDAHIPNEQWTMLQAHLETCAECRAYADQLGGVEKLLKRALRGGWETVPGPNQNIPAQTLASLRGRAQTRTRLLIAAGGAALIGLVALLGGPAGIRARLAASSAQATAQASIPVTQVTPAPTGSAAPTVSAGQFPDVVAYVSRRDGKPNGDSEVYLLNPGSQPIDLTDNPAQDTDPAWSPDGEWLAFLSNRNKKVELFVTSITSGRVVQLTDEPGVTWQGPLSWSPDGKWIALSGTRDSQGGQSWVYLAALDGSGARALAGSRSGSSPKFSPAGDQLAFVFSDGAHDGVTITNLANGEQATTRWNANPLVPPPASGSSFDWSLDGSGLAFVAADLNPLAEVASGANGTSADAPPVLSEPGSQVIAVRNLGGSLAAFANAFQAGVNGVYPSGAGQSGSLQVASSHWPGAYRAVTWAANGGVVFLQDLEDARAHDKPSALPEGCWTVQLSQPAFRRESSPVGPSSFGGLCVVGGMQRSSWTPDGRWLVVLGRLPSEQKYSIFALRMPGRFGRGYFNEQNATPVPGGIPSGSQSPGQPAQGTILRLVNDPWAGELPAPRPRLNPNSRPLSIDPQPAKTLAGSAAADQRPSDLSQRSGGPQGQITYVVQNNSMSVLVSSNPDGTGGQVLLATLSENHCPVWSPDGRLIALTQTSTTPPTSGAGSASAAAPAGTPAAALAGSASQAGSPDGVENPALADGVFILDPSIGGPREISLESSPPGTSPTNTTYAYGCPAWSPDSRYISALVRTGREWYLAVYPAVQTSRSSSDQAQPQARYIGLGQSFWPTGPTWSADGSSIYLLRTEASGAPPGMRVISVPQDPTVPLTSENYTGVWQSQTVPTLAINPDGRSLAELEVIGPARSAHIHPVILSGHADASPVGSPAYLNPPEGTITSGSMSWLSGNTFGVILQGDAADQSKTMIYLYHLETNTVQQLALLGDRVNSAAWSPDGNWLVLSAESGLWGLDINGALQGNAAPTWLSPQPVQDLTWK